MELHPDATRIDTLIDWAAHGLNPPRREPAADGVMLSVWDEGPQDGPSPPLVLLHGFPEAGFSWRHQIRALSAAGLRVIAMDQRGYGLSDSPERVEDFDIAALCADVIALLDARGIARAVMVGHDWGGLVAWALATRHPDRVAGVIALNTPYTKHAPADPISLYRKRFGPDHYIVFFQQPGQAEAVLEADLARTFGFYLRRAGASLGELAPAPGAGSGPPPLARMLAAFEPHGRTDALLSPQELAVYLALYGRSGFRGPVSWYRNFTRNWQLSAGIADHVAQPALMIMAEHDGVLPPSATMGMEKYVPDLDRHLIANCGHWTQQEQPEAVNSAILAWIARRFGSRAG